MFLKDFQATVVNDDQKINKYHKDTSVKTCKELVVPILISTSFSTTVEPGKI